MSCAAIQRAERGRSCVMQAHAWRAPQSAHTIPVAAATCYRRAPACVGPRGRPCMPAGAQGGSRCQPFMRRPPGSLPTSLARPRTAGVRMVAIAAGAHHSLAVSEAGQLFAWGRAGRLGHGLSPGGDAREEAAPRLARTRRERRPLRCLCSGLCCVGAGCCRHDERAGVCVAAPSVHEHTHCSSRGGTPRTVPSGALSARARRVKHAALPAPCHTAAAGPQGARAPLCRSRLRMGARTV